MLVRRVTVGAASPKHRYSAARMPQGGSALLCMVRAPAPLCAAPRLCYQLSMYLALFPASHKVRVTSPLCTDKRTFRPRRMDLPDSSVELGLL